MWDAWLMVFFLAGDFLFFELGKRRGDERQADFLWRRIESGSVSLLMGRMMPFVDALFSEGRILPCFRARLSIFEESIDGAYSDLSCSRSRWMKCLLCIISLSLSFPSFFSLWSLGFGTIYVSGFTIQLVRVHVWLAGYGISCKGFYFGGRS